MFGDIHEHNIKQSSRGQKDIFFLLIFSRRAGDHGYQNLVIYAPKKFGSDKIVRTTYVPYVHTLYVHPISVDNRERARARNKKRGQFRYSGVRK